MLNNTDKEWEKYGNTDPYFGVVSHDKYHKSQLNAQIKEEFFNSGAEYVSHIIMKIKKHLDPNFAPKKSVDFGCGVGRLVVPLANFSENIVGVDVSPSMLEEARKNCADKEISNAIFVQSDDDLSSLNETYDFVHSFIVFQHIPVKRGEKIYEALLSRLESGGIGVLHFTYSKPNTAKNRISQLALDYIPFAKILINLVKGRNLFTPHMQMNPYNINFILQVMQKSGVANCYIEFTDHSDISGVIIYFQKLK